MSWRFGWCTTQKKTFLAISEKRPRKLDEIIKIGTRGSKLALWQAEHIAGILKKDGLETEIVTIQTTGDKNLHKNLSKLGVKGVFTDEIEKQLRSGEIHIAVHSAKDVPSQLDDDLDLIAFSKREKVNDVIVSYNKYFTLDDDSQKLVLGTSSSRRSAQIKRSYPKVKTVDVRGNLQTRMRKLDEGICDALVLAYAGVFRMNFSKHIVLELPLDEFTPAVGQGALAIEAAVNLDKNIKNKVRTLVNDPKTELCLLAERAFLREVEGGCSMPIYCLATLENDKLNIRGGIVAPNGKKEAIAELTENSDNPKALGKKLADQLMNENGGLEILEELKA